MRQRSRVDLVALSLDHGASSNDPLRPSGVFASPRIDLRATGADQNRETGHEPLMPVRRKSRRLALPTPQILIVDDDESVGRALTAGSGPRSRRTRWFTRPI